MENIDIRMLAVIEEIYRTKSISKAAEKLDLGQPAVSMTLAKFRRHYDDQLFVRTTRGMEPTPLAQDIIGPIRLILTTLTLALQHRASFDPLTSDRTFSICMTDVGQRVMMPKLLAHLRKVAPAVSIDLSYVSENTLRDLESGQVDIALGFLAVQEAGIYQRALFSEEFVCLVSSTHPRLTGNTLTLAQFEAESHLVVATQGSGHNIVDKTLAEHGIKRRIGLRIPNFLGVVSNIVGTEFLAIVPRRFGQTVAVNNDMKLMALPFPSPPYRVMQHWHERYANDPGNTWMREMIFQLFSE